MDESDVLPADIVRWVPSRKAAVVRAIRDGRITRLEACRRWKLSLEELDAWERSLEVAGQPGLRTTRIQAYQPLMSKHKRD